MSYLFHDTYAESTKLIVWLIIIIHAIFPKIESKGKSNNNEHTPGFNTVPEDPL